MANLWKNFDGEPFLINPHLAIIGNPKKGKKKSMARRKTHRRGRKATPRRRTRRTRTRARRNPFLSPGAVIGNPRRRRGRKASPRRNPRRKRHYRRNPAVLGMQFPALQTVAFVGVGFVGTPLLEGFITSFVPATFATSTIGKYVIRVGSMLALTWGAKQVIGQGQSNLVAIGGGLYVLTSLIKDFAPGVIPGLGGSIPGIAGSLPGIAAYQSRLSAYQSRLSSYTPKLGAQDYGARTSANFAGNGGMNIVASRNRRFQ